MKLPEQPTADARRVWVIGHCWRCDVAGLPVMWLGPVHSEDHGHGPFYACDWCIRRLEELVAASVAGRSPSQFSAPQGGAA